MDLEGEMFYIQFLDLFFELKPSLRTMVVSSSDTNQREIKAALDIRYRDLCRNQGKNNLIEKMIGTYSFDLTLWDRIGDSLHSFEYTPLFWVS